METKFFRFGGILFFLCVFAPSAFAVKEYYSISRSVRALGMGGAFYGLSNDENALFYNPAGLGFYEKGSDFMLSVKGDLSPGILSAASTLIQSANKTVGQIVSDLETYQGTPMYGGLTPLMAYYVRKRFAAGLLLGDTKVDLSLLGRDLDTSIDVSLLSDSGFFLGSGFKVAPNLSVGMNLKMVFRAGGSRQFTVTDIAQGSGLSGDLSTWGGAGLGVDFDLGAMYELPKIASGVTTRLSLSLNNVLASPLNAVRLRLGSSASSPPGLSRMVTLAGHMRLPGVLGADQVDLLLDLSEFGLGGQSDPELGARSGSIWKHVNFGLELPYRNWFFARLGFRQGNFTAGMGIDARFFQMDIATYAEELATLPGRLTSRRVAFRLAFGFGGAKPSVASATAASEPSPAETPTVAETPVGN
jgi:hypothetical protein